MFFSCFACEEPLAALNAKGGPQIEQKDQLLEATCKNGESLKMPASDLQLSPWGTVSEARVKTLRERFAHYCSAQDDEKKIRQAQRKTIDEAIAAYRISVGSNDLDARRSALCLELALLLPRSKEARENGIRKNTNLYGCKTPDDNVASAGQWRTDVRPDKKSVSASLYSKKDRLSLRCIDDKLTFLFHPSERVYKKTTSIRARLDRETKEWNASLSKGRRSIDIEGADFRIVELKGKDTLSLTYKNTKKRSRTKTFKIKGFDVLRPFFARFCTPR